MIYKFDFPKIKISEQNILCVSDDGVGEIELHADGSRNKQGELSLSFPKKAFLNVENHSEVASLSYKKIGHKLAKKISLTSGLDYYFLYNKENGFFDRKGSLIDAFGEEYDVKSVARRDFYSELINVLKIRLILGYLGSKTKKESIESYFRIAHKYVIKEKYNLSTSECLSFAKEIVDKSFFPENMYSGFLKELHKTFYNTELTKGEILSIDTMAKLSLMNEKKAKTVFSDEDLYNEILNKIDADRKARKLNISKLKEVMGNIK